MLLDLYGLLPVLDLYGPSVMTDVHLGAESTHTSLDELFAEPFPLLYEDSIRVEFRCIYLSRCLRSALLSYLQSCHRRHIDLQRHAPCAQMSS